MLGPEARTDGDSKFALIESSVEALKARGAHFVSEVQDGPGWGICTAHLRDLEGNLIELYTPLPRDAWTEGLREADETCR